MISTVKKLRAIMKECNYKNVAAAHELGIARPTLYYWLKNNFDSFNEVSVKKINACYEKIIEKNGGTK